MESYIRDELLDKFTGYFVPSLNLAQSFYRYWLIDCIGFFALWTIFQPCNGGFLLEMIFLDAINDLWVLHFAIIVLFEVPRVMKFSVHPNSIPRYFVLNIYTSTTISTMGSWNLQFCYIHTLTHHYNRLTLSDLWTGKEKKNLKEIVYYHYM